MKQKFYALETYRGFAALMIAAIHFDVNSPIVNHSLANGYFVHFFFTLSGFVIFYNYENKVNNLDDLKNFLKKRFFRLYPLHLFFLLIFLMIEFIKYFLEIRYDYKANNLPFSKNDTDSFFANLFLVHTFLKEYTFNTPSWSISAEFITYIFFGFLIYFSKKIIISLLIVLITFLMRINDDLFFGASHSGYKSLIDCLYSFYLGAIFCKIYLNINEHYVYKKFKNYLSFFFLSLTIFLMIYLNGKLLIILPLIFGLTIMFSCAIEKDNFLGKILLNNFLLYLGKISYSIYMSHLFVFWSLTQFFRFILKIETFTEVNTGFIKLNLSTSEANLFAITAYFVTILSSIFLYRYIENNTFYSRIKSNKN
tara:strand:- start:2492 stop:3589 length:1098 start_codon:yes stop_codon:yes gene_type:complete